MDYDDGYIQNPMVGFKYKYFSDGGDDDDCSGAAVFFGTFFDYLVECFSRGVLRFRSTMWDKSRSALELMI